MPGRLYKQQQMAFIPENINVHATCHYGAAKIFTCDVKIVSIAMRVVNLLNISSLETANQLLEYIDRKFPLNNSIFTPSE